MINALLRWSLQHRTSVLIAAAAVVLYGAWMVSGLKLDALPDLSETQVIVKAQYPGQPPQLVEDQVTYPLTTALLGVPGATTVRAVSMFGEAYVYVVFSDAVDPYWARSRVIERTAQLAGRLPADAKVSLGPDASGTGWVYQYALVSRSGQTPLHELRRLQDFHLRQELQSVEGVAEVATFGGAGRQLQIEIDSERLAALGLTVRSLAESVSEANRASGGSAMEVGRQRMFVTADARLRTAEDLRDIPVGRDPNGAILRLRQVARVTNGPAPKEGVGDLNGTGEVVGGIVVMRQGANAADTVRQLRERLEQLRPSLPADVDVVATYDRSTLIAQAVRSLSTRLVEEGVVVALVCAVFLGRLRSALVAIVTLPIGLLVAGAILRAQGITANIMSLGGLAIAIGAMVDASVVMVETMHRKLESAGDAKHLHWQLVRDSALEVGPALFFSLLVITVSFLPVFSLQGQEGKLFAPLALTKTYAMAAAALLSVTLVPVLIGYFVKGPVSRERKSLLNRLLRSIYRPLLNWALGSPRWVMGLSVAVAISSILPLYRMGSEFMPPLDEGDLLYMPTTLPSVSVDEAAEILRITDGLIRAMPEVAIVHGKAGRSDSATDPAPMSMLETTIVLKPRSQWPEPISTQELIRRLDERVRLAGLSNSWGFPIRTRIEMLSTGVKTQLALRITGPDPSRIQQLTEKAEAALRNVSGVRDIFAERSNSGRYIDIAMDRVKANIHGVSSADIAQLVAGPIGGAEVDTLSVGRERYPIVVRLPREERDSIGALQRMRIRNASGATTAVSQVANVKVTDGPAEIKSENARPVGYVLLSVEDADIGRVLRRAESALRQAGVQEPGYSLTFVGQYLRLKGATLHLVGMSAATLLLVGVILQLHFHSWRRVGIVMCSLPFAVAGGAWLSYVLGYQWSFATTVGFLALAGLAAEFCVVMLLYIDRAAMQQGGEAVVLSHAGLRRAIVRGALLRLRPKSMTVAVIVAGLAPIMFSTGVGVDVMRRIAAPMLGGMITVPLFSMLVVPVIYLKTFGSGRARQARVRE